MLRHKRRADIQQRRTRALGTIRCYIENDVLPGFGVKGGFTIDLPSLGNRSLLYYLDIPQVPQMVLRAESHRRKLVRRLTGQELLFQFGLPVPEVTYRDLRFRTRLHWGYYFMVEQRLEGIPFREHPNPYIMASRLGETFALLHSNAARHKSHPGSVRWPPKSNFIRLRKKAKEWFSRYQAAHCPDPERIRAWLDRWPKEAWSPTPRLCMGDIASTNILIHGEQIHLVDLSSVKLSSALLEMVRMRGKVLGDRDEAWEDFLKGYIGTAKSDLRLEIEQYLPLLDGLQRIRVAGKSSNPESMAYHCQKLFEIIRLTS